MRRAKLLQAISIGLIVSSTLSNDVSASILSKIFRRSSDMYVSELNQMKVLDMDFNHNEIRNTVNNKLYNSAEGNMALVNSVNGIGIQPNVDYIRIPSSDINIPSDQEYVTVSFMYKYGGQDDIQMLCAFGYYDLYLYKGMLGFNTGMGDVYGLWYTPPTDRYINITAVFHKTNVTKNKLYIDGVKQNLSHLIDGCYPSIKANVFQNDFYISNWSLRPDETMYRASDGSIFDEFKIFKSNITDAQAEKLAIAHNIPELYVEKENDYVKASWATEILETDTIYRYDFEDGQFTPGFNWAPNIFGDNTGGQKVVDTDSYSGSRSIFLPRSYDYQGNWYNFPDTRSNQNIMRYGVLRIPNGTKLSISFRAKSDGTHNIIGAFGDGGWGESLEILKPTVVNYTPAGSYSVVVDSIDGLYVGRNITSDKDAKNRVSMSQITDIINNGDGTYTIKVGQPFGLPFEKGEKLKCRPWRGGWNFPEITVTNNNWSLYNMNTTVHDSSDYDMATRGATFYIASTNKGTVYLDDIRFGYATKSILYRDGRKIYEGYDSEYKDTSATDKAAPTMKNNFTVSTEYVKDVRKVNIGISKAVDNGTMYSYNVQGVGNSGNSTFISESKDITITSGLKGYSYVIDTNANTIPNNEVNLLANESNIEYAIPKNNTNNYYLHIKPIDNMGNVGNTIHYLIDNPKLTLTENDAEQQVKLDWTMANSNDRLFKLFKREYGQSDFQSIGNTDLQNVNQVKVLNVYPVGGNYSTFTTWDGETLSLPASASLKRWMEEPNKHHPKGYGQGIIEVTPVDIDLFNNNPESYLFDASGEYKYDVIMFGTFDGNGEKDLSSKAYYATKSFIDSGRGVLFGHDTVTQWLNREYFPKFKSYLNVETYGYTVVNDWDWWDLPPSEIWTMPWSGGTEVILEKKGVLTNYPWDIGDVGDTFSIPYTHTNSQVAKGDVWIKFINPTSDTITNVPVDTKEYSHNGVGTNMAYLTTVNNVAMIQTGHAIGRYDATDDEQKIIANTLFYLNQLSDATSRVDNAAYDNSAPNSPTLKDFNLQGFNMVFTLNNPTDNSTKYEYYIESNSKNGSETTLSNIVTADIESGLKGFVYVIDDSSNTKPTLKNTFTKEPKITIPATTKNKYLHVSSIDNAGNVSNAIHINLSDYIPDGPTISLITPNNDRLFLQN